jgi:hypothetical protein
VQWGLQLELRNRKALSATDIIVGGGVLLVVLLVVVVPTCQLV